MTERKAGMRVYWIGLVLNAFNNLQKRIENLKDFIKSMDSYSWNDFCEKYDVDSETGLPDGDVHTSYAEDFMKELDFIHRNEYSEENRTKIKVFVIEGKETWDYIKNWIEQGM